MVKYEEILVDALIRHEKIIEELTFDRVSFDEFLVKYDDFYLRYALDGHESDAGEKAILDSYNRRIELHKIIYEEAFQGLCSDEDADRTIYKAHGRFGSKEATRRIKQIFEKWKKEQ